MSRYVVTFDMNSNPVYQARYTVKVETETRKTAIALATQILREHAPGFNAQYIEEIEIVPDMTEAL